MDQDQAIKTILEAVANLDIDEVAGYVRAALMAGVDPGKVLNDGLSAGMQVVGERFQSGEYYLTDLILAGEVMKAGLVPLRPVLTKTDLQGKGKVVLATVKGDVHDIGKNLVFMMLNAAGYEVIDLGVDVAPQKIVEAVRLHNARIVGLSVLLTPMVNQLHATINALVEAGLREHIKIIIGGACTTPQLAEALGCDAHGADAVAAVQICNRLTSSILVA